MSEADARTAASLSFVCEDCGRVHNRNNPPCNDCGSMSLTATERTEDHTTIDEDESWALVRDADTDLTGTKVFVYVVAGATLLLGAFEVATGTTLPGVASVVAAVVAMPASRWRLERRAGTHLSPQAVLVVYLLLVVVGHAVPWAT